MGRRRLVALSIWSLLGFMVLIGLGTWQIQRLHWKEGLIAERDAAMAAQPVALPYDPVEIARLEYHQVLVTGTFLNEHELYLNGTDRRSGQGGLLVVTPLRRGGGGVVLVERGWIPTERRDPATRAAGNSPHVAIVGILRLPPDGKPGWFVPDNDPARNQWFFIDPPAMARAIGVDDVLPFYIDAGPAPNPGGLPIGGQGNADLVNNHLQYAITWYALAAALAVIYLLVLRRELTAQPCRNS